MRAVLICAFALLALACVQTGFSEVVNGLPIAYNKHRPEREWDIFGIGRKICAPGSLRRLDCNTCRCNDRGTDWECTLKGCPKHYPQHRPKQELDVVTEMPRICEPGSTKAMDCNTCFCTADGTAWGCTLKGCLGDETLYRPKRELDVVREMPRICEPGSTKAMDCNTCFCTADGTAWGCTLKGCLGDETLYRPTRARRSNVCNGSMRTTGCLKCYCDEDAAFETCFGIAGCGDTTEF
ncbi:uncharacterized protein LOC124409464 [Diprion similis]|uniref:uncharacterized protein LOC124409464 n=1 Tax=Diprion similis TaxID=362088 RepID=UPI001EF9042C|nr:uncharacterized protein LOC124409464 [Diprion similis]